MILNTSQLLDDIDSTDPNFLSEYLLVCEARTESLAEGRWRFTLERADGSPVLSASDVDFGDLNRLTLLAAVRGLESIDGPSGVALLSNNRYLIRSLSDSLPRWRETNFVWEHYGRRVDVQHADLWRRIDRALAIHRVEACLISSRLVSSGAARTAGSGVEHRDAVRFRVDGAHKATRPPKSASMPQDRLRRWLLGNASTSAAPAARERISTADLVAAQ